MLIMPRKSNLPDPIVKQCIERIRAYIEHENVNVLKLSSLARVQQSALARFLNGERKTVTPSARKVLDFINARHNQHNMNMPLRAIIGKYRLRPDPEGLKLINEAVCRLWDGERGSANIIAALILTLEPALSMILAARSPDSLGK